MCPSLIEIGSKTAEKNSAQTNRQTDRHYENNGQLAMKQHSPTHHPDHHPTFISFFHLPWSIASFLYKLRAWQSFCTTSFHVLFDIPLGLEPSTSYSIHFFTQSVSSFRSTCPYHRNLFWCSIDIIHLFLVFLLTPYLELCLCKIVPLKLKKLFWGVCLNYKYYHTQPK